MPRRPDGRYQLLGEIARGGMGVVLKGRDPDLGRDLAFKVLRTELVGRAGAEQRFVEEAQVGGQLQHPGIVPVYDLGRFGDGRPYFAMKLVKGRTLADLLADRPHPGHDVGRFVRHFLQVCQTVAYAHSRGVIHRDLKPANVMVGGFDEVLVMDWGLAKVLPRGGLADEHKASRERERPEADAPDEPTEIRTVRFGSGSDTAAGSVLGTPAFMPPEQAGGEVDRLDERADVFGLGAILCVILTGRPPYVAESGEAVRLMAVRGQLAEALARLDGCGADVELVALCKRCLSADREARPRQAGEVSAALAGHLAGVDERARRAEREWAEREQAEAALRVQLEDERRAAAERSRRERTAEAVGGLLAQAAEALRAGDGAKAAVTLDAAENRAREGGADGSAGRLEALRADVVVLRELNEVDQFRWTPDGSKFPDVGKVAARYRRVLARFGADPDAVPVEALAARVAGSAVRDRLVSALDRVLRAGHSARVRDILRRLDADPLRDAVRDAVAANDSTRMRELAGRAGGTAAGAAGGGGAATARRSRVADGDGGHLLDQSVSERG
jgi:serine/threonine-protein kinase